MESLVLEDLELEVIGALYTLNKENLVELCSFLNIAGYEKVLDKKRSLLISFISNHLEREEIKECEDEGMASLLNLKDKIKELEGTIGTSSPLKIDQRDHIAGQSHQKDQVPEQVTQPLEQVNQPSEQERLQKQVVEALQVALLSLQPKCESNEPGNTTMNRPDTAHVSIQNTVHTRVPPPWHKEFKISGQIGEPGQKDKLTFSSLAHQIEHGIGKGIPELEIVDAVIRAIAPGMQLRSYLEGKANLTLPTLRRILRSHYQEKSATELYKQLTSEIQGNKETPQTFLIRALDLRQKILFASQEAESGLRYDPALVQSMFLHTVLTGLQDDSIKSDMQPYLQQPHSSDELLLEKLNIACANETERQKKKKLLVHQRPATVHSAQTSNASVEKKEKMQIQQNTDKIHPELLSELREMRSDMALLKNLRAEISQIRESIQQPQFTHPPILGGQESMPARQMQDPPQECWPACRPGQRGETGQFQQRFAPQRHYPAPHRVRPRRCYSCQQSGSEDYCMHCYRCGSSEHFLAGCRARSTTPFRGNPLNEDRLPPRDRE